MEHKKGFIGNVMVYDKEIFINTNDGTGYDKIIDKMEQYINWSASKIRLSGFDHEDIKQLIVVFILDGIKNYNHDYGIKLSTFLYIHVKNRMVSRIKEETKQSLSATYIRPTHKLICSCSNSFRSNKKMTEIRCNICDEAPNNKWTIWTERLNPISLDALTANKDEDALSKLQRFSFWYNEETLADIENKIDFYNIIKNESYKTRKIAEAVYFNGFSITEAAKEVDVCCWAASLRLKKLKNNPKIRELFLND